MSPRPSAELSGLLYALADEIRAEEEAKARAAAELERAKTLAAPIDSTISENNEILSVAMQSAVATGTGIVHTTVSESGSVTVAHIPTERAVDTGKTIKLGEINAMLSPVSVNAEGLASLGIHPVATDKNAKRYEANKFPTICRLISEHVMAQAFKKAA